MTPCLDVTVPDLSTVPYLNNPVSNFGLPVPDLYVTVPDLSTVPYLNNPVSNFGTPVPDLSTVSYLNNPVSPIHDLAFTNPYLHITVSVIFIATLWFLTFTLPFLMPKV